MLDVNRLRVFRAVIASGSVHAAATHLGYTPSTISQHLSVLQRETGLKLFEKDGRGIVPTPAARRLAEESESVMGELARLGGVVNDLRVGKSARLSIATFHSAAQAWLPRVGAALRRELPDLTLDIGLNEDESPRSVHRPDIDLRNEALTATPHRVSDYSRHVLHEEGYVALVHESHPMAGQQGVAVAALAEESLIADEIPDAPCSLIVRDAFRAAGVPPRYVAHLDDHHTAIAFVAAGFGVAVVPELVLQTTLPPTVRAVVLHSPQPRRRIVAMVRHAVEPNPATQRCLQLLKEVARSPAP